MKILVTGAAGFIGGHVSKLLTRLDHEVIGFDNFSPYYSPEMKKAHLVGNPGFRLDEIDISNRELMLRSIREISPDCVIHLAAQGGVRASTTNPLPYITANQIGFLNVLEASEKVRVEKFIYASSSSVYGEGLEAPFKEDAILSAPKSLYALSKLSNENIAKNLPFAGVERIGLRFFTVYGPWGRPDMAVFRLLASFLLGEEFLLQFDEQLLVARPQAIEDARVADDLNLEVAVVTRATLEDLGQLALDFDTHGLGALDDATARAVLAVIVER